MSYSRPVQELLSTQPDEQRRKDTDHQVFHQFNSLLTPDLSSVQSSTSLSLSSCKSSDRLRYRSAELTRITSFSDSSFSKKRGRIRPSTTSFSSSLPFRSYDDVSKIKKKRIDSLSESPEFSSGKMNRVSSQKLFVILLSSFLHIIPSIINTVAGVTVHEVKLLTDSGKSDFAQVGEGVIFSCLYILDPGEVILSIVWEKDKEQVYSHITGIQQVPIVSGILKGHVDTSNESPSSLVVKNVTIEMQGTFSCHVISNKSRSQNEIFLIVILDACSESSWETHSDMVSCVEDITFYCRGMFPKPSPVCGIYNDHTGSYIQSVSFDRVEKMDDGTYEISLFRRFFSKDWLKYPGKLSFRCFIIVVSTTWRKGIHHRLFGDAGCPNPPTNVPNGYYNLTSGDKTCWQTPKESSRIRYSCDPGHELLGPESMVCKNGSWKALPSAKYLLSDEYEENSSLDDEEDDETIIAGKNYETEVGQSSRQLGFADQAKRFKEPRHKFIPRGPVITVCNSSFGRGKSILSSSSIFFLSSSCSPSFIIILGYILIYLLS